MAALHYICPEKSYHVGCFPPEEGYTDTPPNLSKFQAPVRLYTVANEAGDRNPTSHYNQERQKNYLQRKGRSWILEGSKGDYKHVGKEATQSSHYALLLMRCPHRPSCEEDCAAPTFQVAPAASWFHFKAEGRYDTLSMEEAQEQLSKTKTGKERWMMAKRAKAAAGGGVLNNLYHVEGAAEIERGVKRAEFHPAGSDGESDGDAGGAGDDLDETVGSRNRLAIQEMDVPTSFSDDEGEGGEFRGARDGLDYGSDLDLENDDFEGDDLSLLTESGHEMLDLLRKTDKERKLEEDEARAAREAAVVDEDEGDTSAAAAAALLQQPLAPVAASSDSTGSNSKRPAASGGTRGSPDAKRARTSKVKRVTADAVRQEMIKLGGRCPTKALMAKFKKRLKTKEDKMRFKAIIRQLLRLEETTLEGKVFVLK